MPGLRAPTSYIDKEPPVVSNVAVSPNLTNGSINVTATANVDDAATGNSRIIAAYYSIDGGAAVAMAASDGGFDGRPRTSLRRFLLLPCMHSTRAPHSVCVQGKDLAGNFSEFADDGACTTLYNRYRPRRR